MDTTIATANQYHHDHTTTHHHTPPVCDNLGRPLPKPKVCKGKGKAKGKGKGKGGSSKHRRESSEAVARPPRCRKVTHLNHLVHHQVHRQAHFVYREPQHHTSPCAPVRSRALPCAPTRSNTPQHAPQGVPRVVPGLLTAR